MSEVEANGIRLEYESEGDPGAPCVLFVLGLGQQLIDCPKGFRSSLLDAGFRVVRFDHRDAGLSHKFDEIPVPDARALIARNQHGPCDDRQYSLHDMARDVVGLMDGLGVASAHLAGYSMGGIVAHLIAADMPARVRSLICLQTTSRAPGLPPRSRAVTEALLDTCHRYETHHEAVTSIARYLRIVSGPVYPLSDGEAEEIAEASVSRCYCPEGVGRQLAALYATPSHAERLPAITAPTLIVHGTLDEVLPRAHGEDQARRIPHARAVFLDGVGHVQSDEVASIVGPHIQEHIEISERRRRS